MEIFFRKKEEAQIVFYFISSSPSSLKNLENIKQITKGTNCTAHAGAQLRNSFQTPRTRQHTHTRDRREMWRECGRLA